MLTNGASSIHVEGLPFPAVLGREPRASHLLGRAPPPSCTQPNRATLACALWVPGPRPSPDCGQRLAEWVREALQAGGLHTREGWGGDDPRPQVCASPRAGRDAGHTPRAWREPLPAWPGRREAAVVSPLRSFCSLFPTPTPVSVRSFGPFQERQWVPVARMFWPGCWTRWRDSEPLEVQGDSPLEGRDRRLAGRDGTRTGLGVPGAPAGRLAVNRVFTLRSVLTRSALNQPLASF